MDEQSFKLSVQISRICTIVAGVASLLSVFFSIWSLIQNGADPSLGCFFMSIISCGCVVMVLLKTNLGKTWTLSYAKNVLETIPPETDNE